MKIGLMVLVSFTGNLLFRQKEISETLKTIRLNEVEVSANRLPILLRSNPGSISLVPRKMLSNMTRVAVSIEALLLIPGVRIDNQIFLRTSWSKLLYSHTAVNAFNDFSQGFMPSSTEEFASNPVGYSGFNTRLVDATSNGSEIEVHGFYTDPVHVATSPPEAGQSEFKN